MVKMSTSMGLSVLGRPDAMGETLRRIALRFGAKMPVAELWPVVFVGGGAMGSDIIVVIGLKSKVLDCGRVWHLGGKSTEICPMDWREAT